MERYRIEGVLGAGGMAVVFLARHRTLGSLHALKLLSIHSPRIEQRLVAEGRAQSGLQHPNVVSVTDLLTVDGSPALVMEYVKGPTLGELLRGYRPTLTEVDALARGVLTGVAAAHAHGVIHRDLKPSNILLATIDGELVPKIADFGLVKAVAGPSTDGGGTRTGTRMGTPAYMAPEQIEDASSVDARADVFSLGAILHELVSGERCFGDGSAFEIWQRIRTGQRRPLPADGAGIPARMRAAISGALRTDCDERIPDVQTLLKIWSTDEGGGFVPVSATDPVGTWSADIHHVSSALKDETPIAGAVDQDHDSRSTRDWLQASALGAGGAASGMEPIRIRQADDAASESSLTADGPGRSSGWRRAQIVGVLVSAAVLVALWSAPWAKDTSASSAVVEDRAERSFRLLGSEGPDAARDQQTFNGVRRALLDADFSLADAMLARLQPRHADDPALVALQGVVLANQDLLGQFIGAQGRAHALAREQDSPLTDVLELTTRSIQERTDIAMFDEWLAMRAANDDDMLDVLFLTHAATFHAADPRRMWTELDALDREHPDWVLPAVAKIRVLLRAGDLQAASVCAQSAVERHPSSAYLVFLTGRIHLAEGQLEAAEHDFSDALTRDPGLIDARIYLADVYLRRGDEPARRKQLGLLLGATIPEGYRGNFMLRHGMELASNGRLAEAEGLWQQCMEEADAISDPGLGVQCVHLGLRNAIALRPPTEWEVWRHRLEDLLLQPELGPYLRQMYAMKNLQAQAEHALELGAVKEAEAIRARIEELDTPAVTTVDRAMALRAIDFKVRLAKGDPDDLRTLLANLLKQEAASGARTKCRHLAEQVAVSQAAGQPGRGVPALERLAAGDCIQGRLGGVLRAKALVALTDARLDEGDRESAHAALVSLGLLWPDADGDLPLVQRAAELEHEASGSLRGWRARRRRAR